MQTGRILITTGEPEITYENVLEVLRDTFPKHLINARRIQYLLDYDAGIQPLQREKKTRTDIDSHCVDNVANEVTEFWLGFAWGAPITLVQSGDGKNKEISDGVTELNKQYDLAKFKAKSQKLARFVEIGGANGNVYIDINVDWDEGKSYFTYDILDPRSSFVIYSSFYPDGRRMMGVTYRHDEKTGSNYFTCFTDKYRFEVVDLQNVINGEPTGSANWHHGTRSGEVNPLGIIPIVEYFRSYDRMGVFERQIPEMDNLNLLVSDFTNDVDQNTQAIWHGNDVEFPKEIITNEDGTTTEKLKKPGTNEWVLTYTSQDGKQPFINPLVVQYDYGGMLNNIVTRRQLILQKCNVPQRNDNSGGSTGVAMSDATGWSQAETAAAKQQLITDTCKMEEVEIVLAVLRESPFVPYDSPLKKLTIADVEPNIKRQKTYEMSTKVNAMVTLLSHGFSLEDATEAIPFFDDPQQVCARSGESVRRYQETIYANESTQNGGEGGDGETAPNSGRLMPDLSDQIQNSPMIDKNRSEK